MIKIDKPKETPEALRLLQKEITEELFNKKDRFKWQTRHYSDPVKTNLHDLYHNKCGFCETKLTNFDMENKFTVEHYRPKVYYYWLGAEWTNLFPACQKCNGNKADYFPLYNNFNDTRRFKKEDAPFDNKGQLVANNCHISYYSSEQPLFWHPDVDDVRDYIEFGTSGQVIIKEGLDTFRKAQAEEMCGKKFIGRLSLEEKRKRQIVDMQKRLMRTLEDVIPTLGVAYSDRDIKLAFSDFFGSLSNLQRPDVEFSLLGYYMNQKFEAFFLNYVEEKSNIEMRKLVEYAQKLFLN
jgi:uncharacterized protein (TIGR02646 family)